MSAIASVRNVVNGPAKGNTGRVRGTCSSSILAGRAGLHSTAVPGIVRTSGLSLPELTTKSKTHFDKLTAPDLTPI